MQLPALTSSLSSMLLAPARTLGATNTSPRSNLPSPSVGEPENTRTPENQPSSNAQEAKATELSDADFRAIAELKRIDREVRAHESAHLAAAGGLARGGASFGYTQGPDGQRYAVSGEVSIDTSPGRNPEDTILKAQRIQAAALAPSQPSGADRAVASAAAQMAASARAELLAERLNTDESDTEDVKSETRETAPVENDKSEVGTNAVTRDTQSGEDLGQLIQQTISAEDALGNLLNTAV